MNILGELTPTNGFVWAPTLKSYKPQEDWIFNGSIRQNITFGAEFHKEKYQKVLRACCFEKVILFSVLFRK